MIRAIHPFPARMAPELAIAGLKELRDQAIVLDPMVGSGTVVRQASELGHCAIGFDIDPLAVLMTKVWTTPVDAAALARLAADVLGDAKRLPDDQPLPWIDEDDETSRYVEFWFSEPQRSDLRRLAYVLSRLDIQNWHAELRAMADVLRLALSRIIITKDQGASLARDVSHSRPHKVADASSFEVMPAFERSVRRLRQALVGAAPVGNVDVSLGDARSLRSIDNGSVDVVLTSPPYLNAIDYMRGHRLSLIWLGHQLSELRYIRSNSIGAERGPDLARSEHPIQAILCAGGPETVSPSRPASPLGNPPPLSLNTARLKCIKEAMGPIDDLQPRHASMVERYAQDVYQSMSEVARVLRSDGKAVLVVGNSCLKGTFIRNSDGVIAAASMVGLQLARRVERELPPQSRYLPMPTTVDEPLGKRMRTETIVTFVPA